MLPGGPLVNYNYDALGRRAGRTVGGVTTSFLYDGMDVVLDINSDGSTVEYLNGSGNMLRQVSAATGSLYFLQDHLSSTAALTNASGGVVERQQYQAFGAGTGSALTRFGYLSSELDNSTGLLFNGGRWYDPQQGRFIMQNPLGFRGGGANFYSLGNNDPVGMTWSNFYFPVSLFGRRSSECGVPQSSKSACADFVDTNLIGFTRQYQHHGEVEIGRGFLATIPRDQSAKERHYAQARVSGFKNRFVAPLDYQGGWVYAHLMGIAGGTMIGNSTIYPWPVGTQTGSQLVAAQMEQDRRELAAVEDMDRLGFALYDYYGTLRPVKDVLTERRSEIAANEAGQSIGNILISAIRGNRTFEQARREIFSLLCDY